MRILTYSHDACGLGHLKRTFVIGRYLASQVPGANVLAVVGSEVAHEFFDPAAANHDYLKLPGAKKIEADHYEPRHLRISYDDLLQTRRAILEATLASFAPELTIIDKNPGGLDGELVDALGRLKTEHPGARVILGLRDILDDPEVTRVEWQDPQRAQWIAETYDAIWIWGESDIYDAVEAYRFPEVLRGMTRYLGYLPPDPPVRDTEELRREAGIRSPGEKLLLIAGGGGGDALPAYRETLRGIRRAGADGIRALLVAGPLMSAQDYASLRSEVAPLAARVKLVSFVKPFEDWLRASDAVICMGGYNTLREIGAIGKPALVLPRDHPRREQSLRAKVFADHGWCEYTDVELEAADAVADFCVRLSADRLTASLSSLPCRGLKSMMGALEKLMPGGQPAPGR